MTNEMLIEEAKKAMTYAYAPYSNFHVGAAVLTKSGKVYLGCNIENSSFGATICAERTAIFKAISEGNQEFDKMAIVGPSDDYTFPCGICRQVMIEFMKEGSIVLEGKNGIKEISVKDFLPYQFQLEE